MPHPDNPFFADDFEDDFWDEEPEPPGWLETLRISLAEKRARIIADAQVRALESRTRVAQAQERYIRAKGSAALAALEAKWRLSEVALEQRFQLMARTVGFESARDWLEDEVERWRLLAEREGWRRLQAMPQMPAEFLDSLLDQPRGLPPLPSLPLPSLPRTPGRQHTATTSMPIEVAVSSEQVESLALKVAGRLIRLSDDESLSGWEKEREELRREFAPLIADEVMARAEELLSRMRG